MSSPGTPAPVGELGTAPSAATVAQALDLSATPHAARPPLDRDFRPDVEGLRAVAVATVVLFHAGVPGFSGGYVGVDVFFVISGFVITKLLLRQVERRGRPVFSEFYARRARRILPAAGLVVVGTLLASYTMLGFIRGNEVADDSRWVAVFLGNYHFAAEGTNYFQSQLPPSPLQNYWSLAVEEQFYIVYPALVAVTVLVLRRYSVAAKLTVLTVAIMAASLAWSIYYTSTDPTGAYFADHYASLGASTRGPAGGRRGVVFTVAVRCLPCRGMGRDRRHRRQCGLVFNDHELPRMAGSTPGGRRRTRHPGRLPRQPGRTRTSARYPGLLLGGQTIVLHLPVALATARVGDTRRDAPAQPALALGAGSPVGRRGGIDFCSLGKPRAQVPVAGRA